VNILNTPGAGAAPDLELDLRGTTGSVVKFANGLKLKALGAAATDTSHPSLSTGTGGALTLGGLITIEGTATGTWTWVTGTPPVWNLTAL
jgi:hypothetical protein